MSKSSNARIQIPITKSTSNAKASSTASSSNSRTKSSASPIVPKRNIIKPAPTTSTKKTSASIADKPVVVSKTAKLRKGIDITGEIQLPNDVYYGVQTARYLTYFEIGTEKMPRPLIKAMGILKKSAAIINESLGILSKDKVVKITKAADEVIEGKLDEHFPLSLWQTGSGAYTNVNINEVLVNRSIEIAGGKIGNSKTASTVLIDDVNKSQSDNDTFASAMHIAAATELRNTLIPAVKRLKNTLANKVKEFDTIIKVGRTHLMDALPLSLGQEFSGYVQQLDNNIVRLEYVLGGLYELAIGGTTVGTGFNTHKDFATKITKQIAKSTKIPFVNAPNKFEALASKDAIVFAHGAIKTFAASLMKISNDIRLLASGPRCGLSELLLPENETDNALNSTIMPGKINPAQCEAVTMVCAQVFGNDTTINFAGASGQLELNTFKPVIIYNFLQSVQILADACNMFEKYCIKGLKANKTAIQAYLEKTFIHINDLQPYIGIENTNAILKQAAKENITLKEAALKLNILTTDEFDRYVKIEKMLAPNIVVVKGRKR